MITFNIAICISHRAVHFATRKISQLLANTCSHASNKSNWYVLTVDSFNVFILVVVLLREETNYSHEEITCIGLVYL